ncbi:NYN domain-containing protein [Glycomyces sp. TRM65418]|uniref:NYN domain-containing protein n=1 Tax=Glycomyces sp. TRM65418 TaxID=2867006 RepID=UPI001CE6CBA9|nr:NYN domain-containing protein [Glycomyces sp. TRM65418]MCC3762122.1 NYN domain-containing protein [Glycomyces sp. TRM65418]QZD56187.1 NYN domain-containing protein [Glycomyces sp. TRM65418]
MLSGQESGDEGPEPGAGPAEAAASGGGAAASEEDPSEPVPADAGPAVFLSEPVRRRAVEIAAVAMPGLPPGKVPSRLRRFLKFSPAKRAKLAKAELAVAVAADTAFREGLATVLAATDSPLIAAVATGGEVSPMADPAEVAALAYLLRPEGWRELIATAVLAIPETTEAPAQEATREVDPKRLTALEKENGKLRGALADQRTAAAGLQEELRRLRRELKEAEDRAVKAAGDLAAERGRLKHLETERRSERRRLESEVESLRAQLERIRKAEREHERLASSRLWLLMETLSGTATGLRRELGLEPAPDRPADHIAEEYCAEPEERPVEGSRGLDQNDPQRLDHLLSLPNPHLIVDGYNVTISAWGETLTLEQQRNRLVQGLGTVAAQTNAEITVVFDGADAIFGAKPSARGVRVLFSAKGQIADDVVVELTRVEPEGRPVIVVSSDQEVAMRVRREGAFPVPSPLLVRWFQRSR